MAEKNSILDSDELKSQDSELSEDQRTAIQEEMTQRLYGPKKGEKKDDEENDEEEETPENKEDEGKEEEEDGDRAVEDKDDKESDDSEDNETPEDKAKREAKEQEEAEEALLKKPETELSDEEKGKKATILKTREEKAFTEEATQFALANKMTIDEAKKELKSYQDMAAKYQNDPKKLGKALVHSQREGSKVAQELKQLRELPHPKDLGEGEMIINGKRYSKEETKKILVEGYRKEFPKVSENLDDDQVMELAVVRLKDQQKTMREAAQTKLAGEAKQKRTDVLATLTDDEKDYSAEIRALVEKTPDATIMDEDWDFEEVKAWARGRYWTPDRIKAIRIESFNKGKEEAKILGRKENDGKGSNKGKPPAPKAKTTLTQEQKEEALNMFKTDGISDEKKFEMYADVLKKRQKKKG